MKNRLIGCTWHDMAFTSRTAMTFYVSCYDVGFLSIGQSLQNVKQRGQLVIPVLELAQNEEFIYIYIYIYIYIDIFTLYKHNLSYE